MAICFKAMIERDISYACAFLGYSQVDILVLMIGNFSDVTSFFLHVV